MERINKLPSSVSLSDRREQIEQKTSNLILLCEKLTISSTL